MSIGPPGVPEQVVHEFNFLITKVCEMYFVIAIFGEEFTINMGGPTIEGYEVWLRENDGASPLYPINKPELYPKPTSSDQK